MIVDLPNLIREKVLSLLKEGKFIEAKTLHDTWLQNHPKKNVIDI